MYSAVSLPLVQENRRSDILASKPSLFQVIAICPYHIPVSFLPGIHECQYYQDLFIHQGSWNGRICRRDMRLKGCVKIVHYCKKGSFLPILTRVFIRVLITKLGIM